jgi:hypothetical protein
VLVFVPGGKNLKVKNSFKQVNVLNIGCNNRAFIYPYHSAGILRNDKAREFPYSKKVEINRQDCANSAAMSSILRLQAAS